MVEGELKNIKYWNPITNVWETTPPTFPFLNYAGFQCTAKNTSSIGSKFFMYWYGFNIYGQRLWSKVTDAGFLTPGGTLTDSIEFFCDLPGVYTATCQLYSWPTGESAQLVDWIGTVNFGVPIANVTGVQEVEAAIDTWNLWKYLTINWGRPSPTSVPLNEDIGIQGVGRNDGNTALNMRMDATIRSPSGLEYLYTGDARSVPAGLLSYNFPKWSFKKKAIEGGDWEADLILYAGPSLGVVDRMDNIPIAHVAGDGPEPEVETLEVDITPIEKGYVTTVPASEEGKTTWHNNNTGTFPYGTDVLVTAHPSAGYMFEKWSDEIIGGVSYQNPEYVQSMTEYRAVKCHFREGTGPSGGEFGELTIINREKVSLGQGDTLRVNISVPYKGVAQNYTLYGSIGSRQYAWPFPDIRWFDEISVGRGTLSCPESLTEFVVVEGSVDIKAEGISEGVDYDLYVKIEEEPSVMDEVDNIIDITTAPGMFDMIGPLLILGLLAFIMPMMGKGEG